MTGDLVPQDRSIDDSETGSSILCCIISAISCFGRGKGLTTLYRESTTPPRSRDIIEA